MRFLYATALETATWGLVAATALLFLASAIPAIGAILDRRRKRAERVAALIPDLHIIRTRINGAINRHANSNLDDEELKSWAENIWEILGMLKPLFKPGRREGLKFTNELYICRHLLTQAYYEYLHARQAERSDRTAKLSRARHLCVATKTTLAAAEDQLPSKLRTIDGERFWDRFSRLSSEREQSADAQIQQARGA